MKTDYTEPKLKILALSPRRVVCGSNYGAAGYAGKDVETQDEYDL